MKQLNQDQLFKGLQELVSEIKYLEKLDDGSVWTSGEDACIYKGLPPFNHNLEYGEMLLSEAVHWKPNHSGMKVKEMYVYGIHREIYSWLEERGWYPKWTDPATLFFWKCTEDSDEEMIGNFEDYQIYLDTHEIDGIEGEILKRLKEKFKEKND